MKKLIVFILLMYSQSSQSQDFILMSSSLKSNNKLSLHIQNISSNNYFISIEDGISMIVKRQEKLKWVDYTSQFSFEEMETLHLNWNKKKKISTFDSTLYQKFCSVINKVNSLPDCYNNSEIIIQINQFCKSIKFIKSKQSFVHDFDFNLKNHPRGKYMFEFSYNINSPEKSFDYYNICSYKIEKLLIKIPVLFDEYKIFNEPIYSNKTILVIH